MKTTYRAAAFFSLAAVLTAGALMKIDRGHPSDQSSPLVLVSQQTDVNLLREKLKDYEEQLRVQRELVENARQDAISAGIQGDNAQANIYAYQDLQEQTKALEATLVPQIKQLRATIATLTGKDSELSYLAQGSQP
jgi:hypothetical protein